MNEKVEVLKTAADQVGSQEAHAIILHGSLKCINNKQKCSRTDHRIVFVDTGPGERIVVKYTLQRTTGRIIHKTGA